MNILTEPQARDRELSLPAGGFCSGVAPEFLEELAGYGAFAEYNEQVIVAVGEPVANLFCVIEGTIAVLRPKDDFGKRRVTTLSRGDCFGEISFFLESASEEELRAEGEVIVWAIPQETLRRLFRDWPESLQLLYNLGILLAQKISLKLHAEAERAG